MQKEFLGPNNWRQRPCKGGSERDQIWIPYRGPRLRHGHGLKMYTSFKALLPPSESYWCNNGTEQEPVTVSTHHMFFHAEGKTTTEQHHSEDSICRWVHQYPALIFLTPALWTVNIKLSLSSSSSHAAAAANELFHKCPSLGKCYRQITQTSRPCAASIILPSCPQSLSVFSMSASPKWISNRSQTNLRRFCSAVFIHFWIWYDLAQWFHLFCKLWDIVRKYKLYGAWKVHSLTL